MGVKRNIDIGMRERVKRSRGGRFVEDKERGRERKSGSI